MEPIVEEPEELEPLVEEPEELGPLVEEPEELGPLVEELEELEPLVEEPEELEPLVEEPEELEPLVEEPEELEPLWEDDAGLLLEIIFDYLDEIYLFEDYRWPMKKQFTNLHRRIMILTEMFEEILEIGQDHLSSDNMQGLHVFCDSLSHAFDLLHLGSRGSTIYMILEREQILTRFNKVSLSLEDALDKLHYWRLDITEEVMEQVGLVHSQFRKAIGRIDDGYDEELKRDLLLLLSDSENDAVFDPNVLKRVQKKIPLMNINDVAEESVALTDMAALTGTGDNPKTIEEIHNMVRKFKDIVVLPTHESSKTGSSTKNENASLSYMGQTFDKKSLVKPDYLRCPISLELMTDPVIVSTGETYERSCLEKWIEAGHNTCPKTHKTIQVSPLIPNLALRNMITEWIEENGIELPRLPAITTCSPAVEPSRISDLLQKLSSSPDLLMQRSAAAEIRLLTKQSAHNRVAIAEAGAIPLLVDLLLQTPDTRCQVHAMTSLLNISLSCDSNKGCIVNNSGALPSIVNLLKLGSMEARENAAATLYSLSVVDENKVTIGDSGAIPFIVKLLSEGTRRGKKDAATALFNLCIYQGNKGKAVKAGIVPILMRLVTEDWGGGMLEEAMAILAILACHPYGKSAIGSADAALPVLMGVIMDGPPRGKEYAADVLVHLSAGDIVYLAKAQELGVMDPLFEITRTGTERGRRKALLLIERLNRFVDQIELDKLVDEETG